MSQTEEDPNDVKVILVGETGTGKTCLINVTIGKQFTDYSPSTIISTFVIKKVNKDGKTYNLNIWDTAGQEQFRAMTKIFVKNSKIVVFVYSIERKDSLKGLEEYWVNTVKEALGDEAIYGMVGNKCDLFEEEEIKTETAKEFANKCNLKFKLVSAKEDPEGFVQFLEELLDDYLQKKGMITTNKDTICINNDANLNKKEKKNCCK